MRRCGSDPRVRKTLVRHSEQRITNTNRDLYTTLEMPSTSTVAGGSAPQARGGKEYVPLVSQAKGDLPLVVQARGDVPSATRANGDMGARRRQKGDNLEEPTLCSSLALHEYIERVKISEPAPIEPNDFLVDTRHINEKVTKRLNFPFDEPIYKNLVEINAAGSSTDLKVKTKGSQRRVKLKKRDPEPKEEDYFPEEEVEDPPLRIPLIKIKSKPIIVSGDVGLYETLRSYEGDTF